MKCNYKGLFRICLIFIVNGLLWSFFRSYLNVVFCIFLVLLIGISIISTSIGAKKIQCNLIFPAKRMESPGEFIIKLQFNNPSVWCGCVAEVRYRLCNQFTNVAGEYEARGLFRPFRGSHIIKTFLVPKRFVEENIYVTSNYCGRIAFETIDIYILDMLELFRIKSRITSHNVAMVFPKYVIPEDVPITAFLSNYEEPKEMTGKGMEDYGDYELREYVQGDDWKTIHWKLSAKQDTWMVRESFTQIHETINLIFELGDYLEQNECRICNLWNVGRYLLEDNYPIQLYWWNGLTNQPQNQYVTEVKEFENIICEILSVSQCNSTGRVEQYFRENGFGEGFVRIVDGQWKGEYVS